MVAERLYRAVVRGEIVYFTETLEHEAGAEDADGRQVVRAPPRTDDVAIEIGKPEAEAEAEAEAEEEDDDDDGAWMGEYSDTDYSDSDGDY